MAEKKTTTTGKAESEKMKDENETAQPLSALSSQLSAFPTTTTAPATAPKGPARYRVRAGGISTPDGAIWQGQIVTAEQLGDAERVAHLLQFGSIEEVNDAAD